MANFKHGHTPKSGASPEYICWQSMISRCEYPKHKSYPQYGGAGIAVCPEWRGSFERFLSDMGARPTPAHTIDRIDGNRGYYPGNCRWADKSTQAKNRRKRDSSSHRIKIDGDKTAHDIAAIVGVGVETIRHRYRAGYRGSDLYEPSLKDRRLPVMRETGRSNLMRLSPEQRSERARLAAMARWTKREGAHP